MPISGDIGFEGNKLCFSLTNGPDTIAACIELADIRRKMFSNMIIPELPPLPDSLKKRMTSEELKKREQAEKEYKVKLAIAIRGGAV